jgi:hypothetical protein
MFAKVFVAVLAVTGLGFAAGFGPAGKATSECCSLGAGCCVAPLPCCDGQTCCDATSGCCESGVCCSPGVPCCEAGDCCDPAAAKPAEVKTSCDAAGTACCRK